MGTHTFTNILGTFTFDDKGVVVKKKLFSSVEEYSQENKGGIDDDKLLHYILSHFKNPEYYQEFYERNMILTKTSVKDAVNNDLLIIQTVSLIEEIDKVRNTLLKRLREWYELYAPEVSQELQDQTQFVKNVVAKTKNELMKQFNVGQTMGADLAEKDVKAILTLADEIARLSTLRDAQEKYLENLTEETCPNVKAIAGSLIAAKLISHAGSLRRLAGFPASTVQILGAEKALFRHMRSKKHKPPKYGILHEHYMISRVKRSMHGKVARALADKISLAARIDYFKGDFIGDTYRKELEDKFEL